MRNLCLICVCILFCDFIFADDCTDGLTEAKELYNSGNYQKAKELFEYVKDECPQNYTEASNWIAKCNNALKPKQSTGSSSTSAYLKVDGSSANSTKYLLNSSSSVTIRVSCSSSYSVSNVPSWCSITNKTSTSFVLNYTTNPNTYTRYGSIDVSGGGTSLRISLEQAAKVSSNSSTTTTSSSLKVSRTSVVATAEGVTEYITVTCNKAWEIEYPSGSMYTATRSGNSVKVVISANTKTSQRSDFFNIRTTDGKEITKVSLSQSGKSTIGGFSYNRPSDGYSFAAYDAYCNNHGDLDITWLGVNTSICTSYEVGFSAMRWRWRWIQVCPLDFMIGTDFISGDFIWAYQPTINFLLPFGGNELVYLGIGPSVGDNTWFKLETGCRLHWAEIFSSDLFMRYDGTFSIGVSLQWSYEIF